MAADCRYSRGHDEATQHHSGPGIERGGHDDRLAYMQDLHPTLLAAAGVETGNCEFDRLDVDGDRATLGNGYADNQRTVRDATHKLNCFNVNGQRTTQLFNLGQDRHEMRDLSADPAQAGRIDAMRQAMRAWGRAMDDPFAEAVAGV